jgi:hypothetical protein
MTRCVHQVRTSEYRWRAALASDRYCVSAVSFSAYAGLRSLLCQLIWRSFSVCDNCCVRQRDKLSYSVCDYYCVWQRNKLTYSRCDYCCVRQRILAVLLSLWLLLCPTANISCSTLLYPTANISCVCDYYCVWQRNKLTYSRCDYCCVRQRILAVLLRLWLLLCPTTNISCSTPSVIIVVSDSEY